MVVIPRRSGGNLRLFPDKASQERRLTRLQKLLFCLKARPHNASVLRCSCEPAMAMHPLSTERVHRRQGTAGDTAPTGDIHLHVIRTNALRRSTCPQPSKLQSIPRASLLPRCLTPRQPGDHYVALPNESKDGWTHAHARQTILVEPQPLYELWSDVSKFPLWQEHVVSVKPARFAGWIQDQSLGSWAIPKT